MSASSSKLEGQHHFIDDVSSLAYSPASLFSSLSLPLIFSVLWLSSSSSSLCFPFIHPSLFYPPSFLYYPLLFSYSFPLSLLPSLSFRLSPSLSLFPSLSFSPLWCGFFLCRIITSYRTFFMYASSAQEAEDWIKILRWKLVSTNLTSFLVLPNFRFVFSVYTEVEEWQKTLAHSSCKTRYTHAHQVPHTKHMESSKMAKREALARRHRAVLCLSVHESASEARVVTCKSFCVTVVLSFILLLTS